VPADVVVAPVVVAVVVAAVVVVGVDDPATVTVCVTEELPPSDV
jgi:hypothetical protein